MIIFCALIAFSCMHTYSNENVRIPTSEEIKLQQKILVLDRKINGLNKHNEWKEFNNVYKGMNRRKEYSGIELQTFSLVAQYHLSEFAKSVDPTYQVWQQMQFDTIREGIAFSNKVHIYLLKDEYESKNAFLKQCKKSESSCCTIQ